MNGLKVKLLAHKVTMDGIEYNRPFEMTLSKDSKRAHEFQSNPAFKVTSVVIPEIKSEVLVKNKEPEKEQEIWKVQGIKQEVVKALIEAGFDTPEKILSDDTEFEQLTDIKGIGEATANAIIAACEEYVKA